ncbi:MAG TPA: DinB family protein, partial [Vicinamibacterales bacterium]
SSTRAARLAQRIEEGAATLAAYAQGLSEAQWAATVSPDGRKVGVIVNHVASVYPIEIHLAKEIAAGRSVEGVTWAAVADMNAQHASDNATAGKGETIALLKANAKVAADAVRSLSDAELDSAAPFSLNAGAPLTAQFVIEDHALRHSWHHLAKIKAALTALATAA